MLAALQFVFWASLIFPDVHQPHIVIFDTIHQSKAVQVP